MFGLFNIVLDMKPYLEDENLLHNLVKNLNTIGIKLMEVREAPIIEDATGKEVAKALILRCKETQLFAKKKYMKATGMTESIYEGLPALM